MTLAVAIYAAVVSTAALLWRVFEWYSAKHLNIVVTGNILELDKVDSFFVSKVHNRSAFPARVIGVTVESAASPAERPQDRWRTGSTAGTGEGAQRVGCSL